MKFVGYNYLEDGEVVEIALFPEDALRLPPLDNQTEVKVWEYTTSIENQDDAWNEVMTAWHEFNGFEPYKPF